jgi:imidazolonepropionase-like amidohydrolase
MATCPPTPSAIATKAGASSASVPTPTPAHRAQSTPGGWLVAAPATVTDWLRKYVAVGDPIVALTHVRVIDGTGAAGRDDQTIVIAQGRILAIGDAAKTPAPSGARVMDMHGLTAMPGLVDMHAHLYYSQYTHGGLADIAFAEQPRSFPRIYLAAGVTTARTTGSVEPYADLAIKKLIDDGEGLGPHFELTAPYIEGPGTPFLQMHPLATPDEARRFVDGWADIGFTSFKAYMQLTRPLLGAAIDAAHARGLKLTGHLCAVGFREAAELGIDGLEHGFFEAHDLVPGKKPDACPEGDPLEKVDVASPEIAETIRLLVAKHVAITSTLAIMESFYRADQTPLDPRALEAMNPVTRDFVSGQHAESAKHPSASFAKELVLERAFVAAGGLLLSGSDPTGYGAVVAGFGDQRQLELLVEAGFTAPEAVQIATANGARYLGVDDQIGTLAAGKRADIVVVNGDPEKHIKDVENVSIVFKDGVGFDAATLLESVKGTVGLQ